MIKITAILLLIAFVSFFQWNRLEDKPISSLCEITTDIRQCPENLGSLFLPRTYSARAIYVGFNREQIHLDFLETLIKEITKLEIAPKLNILIPQLDEYDAHHILKKYFNQEIYSFINLIPVASKESIWAQDYLEILFNTETGKSEIVDLPYYEREGEDLPASVALTCQKELIPQAEFTTEYKPGNGDYGGNIEPLSTKVLAVGTNLSDETFKVLQSLTAQEIVELNVNWLETGHVDEIFTTLPFKKDAEACEQALLIASPKLALDIITRAPLDLKEEKNPNAPFYNAKIVWADHYHCLYRKNKNREDCIELEKANLAYQKIIDQDIDKVQKLMLKNHGCRLKEEKFPQLFVPLERQKEYGTYDDRAVALNPNSVNNIFFFPNLILAKQIFYPFQEEVDKVLSKFPYKKIYIDDKFAHELNGGIHCATNISYGCMPKR